jgi:hypothetical protein
MHGPVTMSPCRVVQSACVPYVRQSACPKLRVHATTNGKSPPKESLHGRTPNTVALLSIRSDAHPHGKVRDAIAKLPKAVWTAAVDGNGDVRHGGDVAEITALLDLSGGRRGCA